jgi:hypothetical protein
MLRRCAAAAAFKRSYNVSGMFFRVKVVGTFVAPYRNQSGFTLAQLPDAANGVVSG